VAEGVEGVFVSGQHPLDQPPLLQRFRDHPVVLLLKKARLDRVSIVPRPPVFDGLRAPPLAQGPLELDVTGTRNPSQLIRPKDSLPPGHLMNRAWAMRRTPRIRRNGEGGRHDQTR
jgi:hypothetical protein